MPGQIDANYSANFQKFVDFANKAYAPNGKGEDTVARFSGMPVGDYKGTFASFMRTAEMKTANDQVRDLFRKTIADMFGGEKFIPDIVRDNMKLEDFNKGKPLTARRINLVKIAIDTLGGGKFTDPASIGKATAMGYVASELPKLARVANIYQQATGCTDAEAESAALDPNSTARRLYDCGGRFTQSAENFKKGLALMADFQEWFANVCSELGNGPGVTAKCMNPSITGTSHARGAEKFIFDEIAVNENIPLEAEDKESVFGMERNPAARFALSKVGDSQHATLAQMPQAQRDLLYAVNDLFHPFAPNGQQGTVIGQGAVFVGRVIKHADELSALKAAGNLTRQTAFDVLYSDISEKGNRDAEAANLIEDILMERLPDSGQIVRAINMLARTGASIDEVLNAMERNIALPSAPYVSTVTKSLVSFGMNGEGGIKAMCGDIHRPSMPTFIATGKEPEGVRNRYVFKFADETLECGGTSEADAKPVLERISAKLRELCTPAHPKQLDTVAYSLGQGQLGQLKCLANHGLFVNEHIPVQYTISKNQETGAISIFIKEPENFPVKFNWKVTVNVDGSSTSTPMRLDHGQYEAKAMTFAGEIAAKLPGKSEAAAKNMIKDVLAYCGDDFELKDVVSRTIRGLCITATATMRTHDEIKARIDAIRANLEEVRKAAAGNNRIEKAGFNLLWGMNGKSVPPGLIGKMLKAASAEKPGEFSKLSATSTPQQITKAVIDIREAVENVMRNAYVQDYLEGADEMGPARAFAFSVLVAKFPEAQLKGVKDVFSSETMSKLFTVMDDLMRDRRPAGAKPVSRNISSFIREQSMALEQVVLQYKKAVESLLGQEEGDGVRPFEGQFDKTAFGDKDIHDLLIPLAERDEAAELDAERRQEYMPRAFPRAQSNAVTAYAIAGEGNAKKVDNLIRIALSHCAASEEAVNYVAANIDRILVSGNGALRTLEEVREISLAIVQRGVAGAADILG